MFLFSLAMFVKKVTHEERKENVEDTNIDAGEESDKEETEGGVKVEVRGKERKGKGKGKGKEKGKEREEDGECGDEEHVYNMLEITLQEVNEDILQHVLPFLRLSVRPPTPSLPFSLLSSSFFFLFVLIGLVFRIWEHFVCYQRGTLLFHCS